jgi:hypothetical protein
MNPLRWRKMTWVLNVWNVLFLIWIIGGVSSRPSKNCATDPDGAPLTTITEGEILCAGQTAVRAP